MKKIALAVTVVAAAFMGVASAQTSDNWVNTNGTVWRNSAGLCWQDGFWTPATANFQCVSKKPVIPKEIVLKADAFFAFDKSDINPAGIELLKELAVQLKQLVEYDKELKSITLIGYTDSLGSAKYNLRLSQRRAAAVGRFLISQGIPARYIVEIGRGAADPVASNATPEGRAQNRRVIVRVVADNTVTK